MAEEKKDKDKEKKIGPKAHAAITKDEKPKEKKSEGGSKGEKHRHKTTHITHHSGGGHTVVHSPGEENEMSYAVPDLNSVNAGMQQNVGEAEPAPPPTPSGPAPAPGV